VTEGRKVVLENGEFGRFLAWGVDTIAHHGVPLTITAAIIELENHQPAFVMLPGFRFVDDKEGDDETYRRNNRRFN